MFKSERGIKKRTQRPSLFMTCTPLRKGIFPLFTAHFLVNITTSAVECSVLLTDNYLFVLHTGLVVAGMTSINQCQCNSRRDHPDSMTPAELLVAEDIVSPLIWPSAPHHPLCVWAPIWPHLWPPMKCHLAKRRIDFCQWQASES